MPEERFPDAREWLFRLGFSIKPWKNGASLEQVISWMDGYSELKLKSDASELVEAAEKLLEWVPKSSPGSSGYIRVKRVEAAISKLRKAWQ